MSQPDTAKSVRPRRAGRLLGSTLGPLAALLLVVVFFGVADHLKDGRDTFLTLANARTIAVQTSIVMAAALGMTLVIISGGIDLSVGTATSLAATVLAWCLLAGYSPLVSLAAGIGCGLATGLVNGLLASVLSVVPFIITLGTMTIWLGLAKMVAKETTVRPLPTQIPDWLPQLVTVRQQPLIFAGGVWLVVALAVVLAIVLRYTVFGRYVFALGSNEATARLCGINVPFIKTWVYSISGLFVGVAGMLQFARLSAGNPTSGVGLELRVIAAVVIGGGSLAGGRGTVLGTLAGAALMGVIASGGTLLGLTNPIQDVIVGVIIVVAVSVDQLRRRTQA